MAAAISDSTDSSLRDGQSVVLASGSTVRARLLRDAGLSVTVEPAAIDEAAVKTALQLEAATVDEAALALARMKAERSASKHPAALVIGADQILECSGLWFDKPADRAQARETLLALRGHHHRLITSVCVQRGADMLWHHGDSADLTVRDFSDAFLDRYLAAMGESVCETVGAYKLEGLGAQLFTRVEGDFFTILGLPLLPLLDFLRGHGVVPR